MTKILKPSSFLLTWGIVYALGAFSDSLRAESMALNPHDSIIGFENLKRLKPSNLDQSQLHQVAKISAVTFETHKRLLASYDELLARKKKWFGSEDLIEIIRIATISKQDIEKVFMVFDDLRKGEGSSYELSILLELTDGAAISNRPMKDVFAAFTDLHIRKSSWYNDKILAAITRLAVGTDNDVEKVFQIYDGYYHSKYKGKNWFKEETILRMTEAVVLSGKDKDELWSEFDTFNNAHKDSKLDEDYRAEAFKFAMAYRLNAEEFFKSYELLSADKKKWFEADKVLDFFEASALRQNYSQLKSADAKERQNWMLLTKSARYFAKADEGSDDVDIDIDVDVSSGSDD